MSDANCCSCSKLIVNWDVYDGIGGYVGPPTCESCIAKMEAAMCPEPTLLEQLALRLVHGRTHHRRINTGGFDPYLGDMWEVGWGSVPVGLRMNSTISWHLEVEWRGRTLAEYYVDDFRSRGWNPLSRGLIWLHGVLEEDRDRNYVEDPMGCLADYE